jgi:hypothetical protein
MTGFPGICGAVKRNSSRYIDLYFPQTVICRWLAVCHHHSLCEPNRLREKILIAYWLTGRCNFNCTGKNHEGLAGTHKPGIFLAEIERNLKMSNQDSKDEKAST